ncbi:MAG: hypothetical protein HQ580_15890 [Planctomycetes bacterium]|nr:hypothetical protein [Planctomycetota bacterium]
MARNKLSTSIFFATSLVLYLVNATAQSITDFIEQDDVSGVEAFVRTHDINKLYYDYTPLCGL